MRIYKVPQTIFTDHKKQVLKVIPLLKNDKGKTKRTEEFMEFKKITTFQLDALWELQRLYKAEIGENEPEDEAKACLTKAMDEGRIFFYGAWENNGLIGCCSVTVGFSTFDYRPSGVFEDFYIRPEYRHKGVARELVRFAYRESGVSSLTVGCADCDVQMYRSLGFSIPLGNLLAFE